MWIFERYIHLFYYLTTNEIPSELSRENIKRVKKKKLVQSARRIWHGKYPTDAYGIIVLLNFHSILDVTFGHLKIKAN